MKNILLEEIERYKRLSFYNPKLTLTENTSEISEQGFNPATTAREVEAAAGKDLQSLIRDYKIADMEVGTLTKLLEKDAKSFEKELNKAIAEDFKNGYKGTLGPAGKNMSKVDLLRRMASDAKSKGRALKPSEIDKIILEISSDNKLKAAQFVDKSATGTIKSTEEDVKSAETLVTKYPGLKKWDWKKLLGWGAKAGIAVGSLYVIYKMTHTDEPPVVTDTDNTERTGVSQYHSCPETFPIAQFCKNETVKKVQGCLGVTPDTKFGPKTKAALESKGVSGTEITQDTYNKVCNQQTTNTVNPDIEDVDAADPNQL
jgi:hypothetical protein